VLAIRSSQSQLTPRATRLNSACHSWFL